MSRRRAWAAAAVTEVAALGMATAYVAANGGFGAGDLPAGALWTLPLAGLVFLVARSHTFRLRLGPWTRLLAALLVGLGLGVGWTLAVALALGPWFGAFSFPLPLCWTFGAVVGLLFAAWREGPRTWPGAVLALVLVVAGLAGQYVEAQKPLPGVLVYLKPNTTPEEENFVWNEVLGFRTPGVEGHALKEGIAGVGAAGSVGDQRVISVEFWKSTSEQQRGRVLADLRASPLVQRVVPVPEGEVVGLGMSP